MFHTLALFVGLTGIAFLGFSVYAFKNISNRLIFIFALMNLAMAIFSFGYAWELLSRTLVSGYMAIKFQYLGLSFLSVYWIIFAYKFRKNTYPGTLLTITIFIVPISIFFIVMTNDLHKLFYTSVEIAAHGKYFSIILEKGIFYYVFIFYSYSVLIFLLFSFYNSYKDNKYHFKKQSSLMLIGSVMPSLFNMLYLAGVTPHNFDPTPFGFLFMSYIFYKAIFKYRFLDLKETIRGSTFDKISEGIMVVDTEFRLVDFNPSAVLFLPFLNKEHIGNYISEYELGKKIEENSKKDFFEIRVRKDKKEHMLEFKKNPIYVKGELLAYIFIFSDATSYKEIISDLSFLATHDFLTGLNNRMSFFKLADAELYRLMRYGGEFSLIMIDIDFFKKVNDTYGHICGDEILRALTNLIKKNLRTIDIFARIGGEEFCILLPQTSLENAHKFSEKIRGIVGKNTFYFNTMEIHITISLGITYCNDKMSQVPFEDLLDLADKALYNSKHRGRNKSSCLQLSLK